MRSAVSPQVAPNCRNTSNTWGSCCKHWNYPSEETNIWLDNIQPGTFWEKMMSPFQFSSFHSASVLPRGHQQQKWLCANIGGCPNIAIWWATGIKMRFSKIGFWVLPCFTMFSKHFKLVFFNTDYVLPANFVGSVPPRPGKLLLRPLWPWFLRWANGFWPFWTRPSLTFVIIYCI